MSKARCQRHQTLTAEICIWHYLYGYHIHQISILITSSTKLMVARASCRLLSMRGSKRLHYFASAGRGFSDCQTQSYRKELSILTRVRREMGCGVDGFLAWGIRKVLITWCLRQGISFGDYEYGWFSVMKIVDRDKAITSTLLVCSWWEGIVLWELLWCF